MLFQYFVQRTFVKTEELAWATMSVNANMASMEIVAISRVSHFKIQILNERCFLNSKNLIYLNVSYFDIVL